MQEEIARTQSNPTTNQLLIFMLASKSGIIMKNPLKTNLTKMINLKARTLDPAKVRKATPNQMGRLTSSRL